MKEKKFYETPFTTVTQIVTEGVFAASGDVVPFDKNSRVSIDHQSGFDTDNGEITIGGWE